MQQNLKRDFSTENIHIAKWLGFMLAKISILFQDDYFFPLKLVEQASTLEVLCWLQIKKKRCIFQMPSRHLKGESTFPSESFRHLCKDDFKMYTSLFGIGFSFEHERSVNIIPLFWLVFLWSFVEVYDVQIHYYGKRMMSYEKNASNVIVFVRAILIVKRRVKSLRIGLFAIGSVG